MFGAILQQFSVDWSETTGPMTEYALGLSVVHDMKDHYLFGLGLTPLTEFQTIVQTYSGRAVAEGTPGVVGGVPVNELISAAVDDELYGPRSKVYGPLETGLLDQHFSQLSSIERLYIRSHIQHVCIKIMQPRLQHIFLTVPGLANLQRRLVSQPELTLSILRDLNWFSEKELTLMLQDNVDYQLNIVAFVDDELHRVSSSIRDAVARYVLSKGLQEYGAIFSPNGYMVYE